VPFSDICFSEINFYVSCSKALVRDFGGSCSCHVDLAVEENFLSSYSASSKMALTLNSAVIEEFVPISFLLKIK
jgi:hypothetical protein